MRRLSRRRLVGLIDGARVRQAIEAAERLSSGEIRVSVSRFFWGDVRRNAEEAFVRLGMANTRQRNAVLFFVVPSRRRFVVLGDTAIHQKVGAEFWRSVGEILGARFHEGDFTGGLVAAIGQVGAELARHFPRAADDADELPNEVSFDDHSPEP